MARKEKVACIWHAFNALDVQQQGTVLKRQLKVLTHNIGNILGLENVEKSLEEFRSSDTLSFLDYLYFLKVELFAALDKKSNDSKTPTSPPASHGRSFFHKHFPQIKKCDWDKIDEVCWFVCNKNFLARDPKVLSVNDVYKMWRVFNMLSEEEGEEAVELVYPVAIHKEETQMLVEKMLTFLGVMFDRESFESKHQNTQCWSFEEFLQVVEEALLEGAGKETLDSMLPLAVGEVFEEYITEVVKKSYLSKKGNMATGYKERWFVLTPHSVRYYTSRDEKEMKGEVAMTSNCRAEILPDKATAKPHRFHLVSEGKTYEISAPDAKSRSEWVAAFQRVIEKCSEPHSPVKQAVSRRGTIRKQRRFQAEEEMKRREKEREEMERTQNQLIEEKEKLARAQDELNKLAALTESEKEARALAEAKLEEEERLRKEEQLKMQELEEMKNRVEDLLDAERRAKEDEEIVRNLQARVLTEEFEKRAELEKLQEELENKWKAEQQKREGLEEFKEQQERQLREEAERLEMLEEQRRNIDQDLQDALQKLKDAEKEREELQKKLEKKDKAGLFKVTLNKLEPIPFVSHRGKGALPTSDPKKPSSNSSSRGPSEEKEIHPSLDNNNEVKVAGGSNNLVKVTGGTDDLVSVTGGNNNLEKDTGGTDDLVKVEGGNNDLVNAEEGMEKVAICDNGEAKQNKLVVDASPENGEQH